MAFGTEKISNFIVKRALWLALLGLLLAIVGGHYTTLLYKNLRTDIEELLPTTARSVIDLNEVTDRLQSIDSLTVLVFSKNSDAGKRFVGDLAALLEKAPRSVIASVEYKVDRELDFFRDRQALYMDLVDLVRIRNYIRDRIDYEKELYNPLNIFREEEIFEPKINLLAIKKKYTGKTGSYERMPEGHYATPDGTKRALLAYLPGKTSSVDQIHLLKNTVVAAIEKLNPKSYDPSLEIHYTGGIQDTLEEQHALIEDLELSTLIVIVLVTFAMLLFFKNVRATMALMFSLFMGTAWTFGISYFAVGYLNANSAFLGSIVIGNGINFGIIFLARYLEDRRGGLAYPQAIHSAIQHTATATWTAALAAGLAYGSLILTGFRGFKQFGVIGLIGMVLCWLSAFVLMPAFLVIFERISPIVKEGATPPKARLAHFVAKMVETFPALLWLVSLVFTGLALLTLTRFSPSTIIETNMNNMRNKASVETGSGYYSHFSDEIFQRYLSPLVILPKTRDQADRVAEVLREKREIEGKTSMIASVQTLNDFIPKNQKEKVAILKEIRALLPPKFLQRLSKEDQNRVGMFLSPQAYRPVRETDLPPLILSKFTEKDKSIGKLVLVEPPLDNSTWDGNRLINFIAQLRDAGDSVAPGSPVAGTLPITSDMVKAISVDGPRATLFAFLAVVLLVIVLFRHVKTILQILISLGLGALWLGGIILGSGYKINFLNFIALPITFGIGVDYGVNIFQRYRQEGGNNIVKVIENTGGAVGLCSFTTIVGYCSLLIAGNQGFVSFGRLAVLGELTCVFAAVISLPAFLLVRKRRKSKKLVGK